MSIDTAHFIQNPQQGRDFINGPNGKVLHAAALAAALTNRRLIAGHFIFGGAGLQQSGFVIHPAYESLLECDEETKLLVDLAPFLAEFQLIKQADYERHRTALAKASRAFGANYYIDDPSALVGHISDIIAGSNNPGRLNDFFGLINLNYCQLQLERALKKHYIDGYDVIPSTTLRPFSGANIIDQVIANLKTRTKRIKRDVLERFRDAARAGAAER